MYNRKVGIQIIMTKEFIPDVYSICKPTDEQLDWNKIKFDKIDWDCMIRGLPWQVVRATYHPEGTPKTSIGIHLNHSLGGKNGENNWYCYPLYRRTNEDDLRADPIYELFDEGPTKHNLLKYSGRAVCWTIKFEETNYIRKEEMREGGHCTIWRNDKKFYDIGAREINYGLAYAQQILVRLQEHPINFWSRKWKEELINRKIWWNSDPCIIRSIIEEQGCVIIEPDRECIQIFRPSPWQIDANDEIDPFAHYDPEENIKADYLDPHINWFRNDDNTKLFLKVRDGAKNRFLDRLQELREKVPIEVYLELHKVAFQIL